MSQESTVTLTNGAYLLLSEFDSQFEAVEVHPLPVLKRWSCGIMVQQHF
jgi:hypothetical protein